MGLYKQYSVHWYDAFWEAQSKAMRAYAQSGQYHTIVESLVRLTLYQSHALNDIVKDDPNLGNDPRFISDGIRVMP